MIRFLLPIGWLILSSVLLTLPGTAFPTEDWLDKIWFDKWVHLGLFGIMVILWNWSIYKTADRRGKSDRRGNYPDKQKPGTVYFFIAVIFLLYGIGMEFIQHYLIPNRSFDTGDIIADAAGCGLGYVFSTRRYIKK